jgi:hypothetical protein
VELGPASSVGYLGRLPRAPRASSKAVSRVPSLVIKVSSSRGGFALEEQRLDVASLRQTSSPPKALSSILIGSSLAFAAQTVTPWVLYTARRLFPSAFSSSSGAAPR